MANDFRWPLFVSQCVLNFLLPVVQIFCLQWIHPQRHQEQLVTTLNWIISGDIWTMKWRGLETRYGDFQKMSNYNQSVNSTIFTWAVASAGDSHVSLLSNPLEDCHMICLFLVQAEFQPIHPPKWGLWEFVLNWLYLLCFFLIQDVDVLGNDILSLVYYFFNLMPLSRGSRYR